MAEGITRTPGDLTSEAFTGDGRNSAPNTHGAKDAEDRVRRAVIAGEGVRKPVVLYIDGDRVPIAPHEPLNFLHLTLAEQDAHLESVRGLWTPEEAAEFRRILDEARAIGADSIQLRKFQPKDN